MHKESISPVSCIPYTDDRKRCLILNGQVPDQSGVARAPISFDFTNRKCVLYKNIVCWVSLYPKVFANKGPVVFLSNKAKGLGSSCSQCGFSIMFEKKSENVLKPVRTVACQSHVHVIGAQPPRPHQVRQHGRHGGGTVTSCASDTTMKVLMFDFTWHASSQLLASPLT